MANAARVREVLARRRDDVEVGSPVDMGVSSRGGIAVRLPDGTVGLVAETADRIELVLDDILEDRRE